MSSGTLFTASAEEALYEQVGTLFRGIESVPPGEIRDGYKIQIAFSLFTLVENGDGYRVVAPDYLKSPFFDTTEDLTIALWIQLEQISLLRLYDVEGQLTRFDDEIGIAKGALQQRHIRLQRFSDVGDGVSAWCVEAIEKGDDGRYRIVPTSDYETLYLYQLLTIRRELLRPLLLPNDYVVVFDNDTLVEILNEQNESIIE